MPNVNTFILENVGNFSNYIDRDLGLSVSEIQQYILGTNSYNINEVVIYYRSHSLRVVVQLRLGVCAMFHVIFH